MVNGHLRLILVLVVATVAVLLSGQRGEVHAAPITVNSLSDSGGGSLRQALIDASSGDVIDFSVTGTIALTSAKLTVSKTLTISGPTSGSLTIDGGGSNEVFDIQSGSTVTISNLTITNGSRSAGGGILNQGTLTLNKVTLTGNNAPNGEGGAILNVGTLTVVNSTISGNSGLVAGAIANRQSFTTTVLNSTITNNTATSSIGGIRNNGGTVTLGNTILAGNTAPSSPNCTGTVSSQGYNLIGDNSGCSFTSATGDVVGTSGSPVDPKLGTLSDNGGPTKTHALLTGSPAIDTGNPATPGGGGGACESTDQTGTTRPQNSRCDIGAFELVVASAVIPGLSQWGLVALAALLVAATVLVRRRVTARAFTA